MRSRRALGFVVLMLALLPPPAARPAAGASLRLERQGEEVYLVKDGARLLIQEQGRWFPSSEGRLRFSLPDGASLRLAGGEVRLERQGRQPVSLSLRNLFEQWLPDDSVWGGHKAANQVRYMHRSGGGVSGTIGNGVAVGRDVLAILSWRANGPSGEPILAQHLVRVRAAPALTIERLRLLDVPGSWLYSLSWSPPLRLVRFGTRLLLATKLASPDEGSGAPPPPPAEWLEISPEGKATRVYAHTPARLYPAGLLDGRYLILGEPNENGKQPLWVYDLLRKRLTVLPGDWQGYIGSDYLYVPEGGGRILVTKSVRVSDQRLDSTTYVVSVPGSRRIALPNPTGSVMHYLWQGLAIIMSDDQVTVYDARSGKLVQRLPLKGP